jgi:C1A family cysteine protease
MAMMRLVSKLRDRKCFVGIAVICLVFLMLTGMNSLPGEASAAGEPQMAPLNPDFEKYIMENTYQAAIPAAPMTTPDGHGLGLIPAPVKLPPPTEGFIASLPTVLPTTFDLRASGVTAVRDQAGCGSCWTFGTMASLESYLKFKKTTTADFSEADLNENHGFDPGVCMGGNYWMSTAYMARWGGPVTEADVPYPYWLTETGGSSAGAATIQSIVGETPGVPTSYRAQNVYFLPQSVTRPHPVADLTTLKTAVQTSGAVGINVYWNDAYYNSTNHSYYVNVNGTGINHAVTVVGWNDSYAKTKFTPQPPGNGAFIVKNSWGTTWGESGYFYLSYYDMALDLGAQFYDAEPLTTYTRVYQYDPFGMVNSYGYGATAAWFANIFMASANASQIKGVSTYTPVKNATYTVYIYKDVTPGNPRSGTLARTKTGTIAKPGYNTIPVMAAGVTANKPFSVVIKLSTPGYTYPIPIEYALAGYSTAASACPGQSFISSNGTTWAEAYDPSIGDFNVCLKAFAVK